MYLLGKFSQGHSLLSLSPPPLTQRELLISLSTSDWFYKMAKKKIEKKKTEEKWFLSQRKLKEKLKMKYFKNETLSHSRVVGEMHCDENFC